jgi:hypothetical protein
MESMIAAATFGIRASCTRQLQIGDRFTDEEREWAIATRPRTTNAGKLVHAAVQKPGDPSTKRDKTHERLAIRRA